jgi:hypothetical protein
MFSVRLKLRILFYGLIITSFTYASLILPYFPHYIVRKVAFFKELDRIGHVASLDCNLVSDMVTFYIKTTPANTNSFVCWFNNAMSTSDVSHHGEFVGYFMTVSNHNIQRNMSE